MAIENAATLHAEIIVDNTRVGGNFAGGAVNRDAAGDLLLLPGLDAHELKGQHAEQARQNDAKLQDCLLIAPAGPA
jgi:hypothetical protein